MNLRNHSSIAPQARLIAVNILSDILSRALPLEQAVLKNHDFAKLEPRDRAFVQLLLKTTLRRLGQIDAMLHAWITTPLEADAAFVQNTLRLGIAQLIWLQTPPHAAVHTAVEIIKQSKWRRYAGMCNAILQRTAREGAAHVEAQDAQRLNLPDILWNSWVDTYGETATREIATILLQEPPLDISVKENANLWAEQLRGTQLAGGGIRLHDVESVSTLPGFHEGAWWVQDAAAALPVRLLGDVKGKRVLDLCAAPGGKTMQLASSGAHVTAVDINARRMRRVEENLARLQLHATCVVEDAATFNPAKAPDAILLDAPCSATGTLRRHPDVAWHRTAKDITRLVMLQQKLLNHALELLQPGGLLVYAVCSLQPEEGDAQIERLLHTRTDVLRLDSSAYAPFPEMVTQTPHGWRTLPNHLAAQGGMDGFFMTLLQRR